LRKSRISLSVQVNLVPLWFSGSIVRIGVGGAVLPPPSIPPPSANHRQLLFTTNPTTTNFTTNSTIISQLPPVIIYHQLHNHQPTTINSTTNSLREKELRSSKRDRARGVRTFLSPLLLKILCPWGFSASILVFETIQKQFILRNVLPLRCFFMWCAHF
jgi:hypothetical protein